MNQTTLHPYSRSVSIIGVGCTPFMYTLDNPETAGLTEGELFGYAAYKAMEDAGIGPKDVDYFFHGQATPFNGSNYITPNMQVSGLVFIRIPYILWYKTMTSRISTAFPRQPFPMLWIRRKIL